MTFLKKLKCIFFQRSERISVFFFFANRSQKVKLNGMFSDCEIVHHGVPVGIVLGALIFLLYVNIFSSIINSTEKKFNWQMTLILLSKSHGNLTKN